MWKFSLLPKWFHRYLTTFIILLRSHIRTRPRLDSTSLPAFITDVAVVILTLCLDTLYSVYCMLRVLRHPTKIVPPP